MEVSRSVIWRLGFLTRGFWSDKVWTPRFDDLHLSLFALSIYITFSFLQYLHSTSRFLKPGIRGGNAATKYFSDEDYRQVYTCQRVSSIYGRGRHCCQPYKRWILATLLLQFKISCLLVGRLPESWNVIVQLQSKHSDSGTKGIKETEQIQSSAFQKHKVEPGNAVGRESGTQASGYFPGRLRLLQKLRIKNKDPQQLMPQFAILQTKELFLCAVFFLLCRSPWTFGPGGESRLLLTVSRLSNPIWSNGAGLAMPRLQQQGSALWGEDGCYSFETPNHGGVTGFAPLVSSYCVDMRCGIVNSKASSALNHWRRHDEKRKEVQINKYTL